MSAVLSDADRALASGFGGDLGLFPQRRERAPEPLADWAIEQATQQALDASDVFCDWLAGGSDVREASDYFGAISVWELQSMLLNPKANDAQRKAASDEMRRRYLDEKAEWITRLANEAMEMAS